jgi:hypothetical protein
MRARSYSVVLSLVCSLAAGPTLQAAEATDSLYVFVDPADPALAAIRKLGERTLDQAGTAMIVEIRHELAESAPALAIGKLHLKHYPLPPAVPGKPAVVALRRTSLQLRNPANAPDAADQAALELIRDQLARGDDVASELVQRVTLPGKPLEWRIYRPLVTLKECLECHGRADALAPGVTDTLKVFYRSDQAVDYRTGSWRGLMRVSIVAPP